MIGKITISEKIYLPILYLVGALILYAILCRIINKTLVINKNRRKNNFQYKRESTIINLIKNVIKYIIAIVLLLSILNVYGVKTSTIVASLGVAGAIIGLAFQDTLKNLLAGISIIFDNHYMQGDIVTINGFKGEVISLGLQTTKIKEYDGRVMIINNSLITSVINHSMYDTKLIISLPVAKNVELDKLESMLKSVSAKVEEMKEVKSSVVFLGIEELNANKYIYKVEVDCEANNHYGVNRAFMKYLKEEYEKNNINVPSELIEIKK